MQRPVEVFLSAVFFLSLRHRFRAIPGMSGTPGTQPTSCFAPERLWQGVKDGDIGDQAPDHAADITEQAHHE